MGRRERGTGGLYKRGNVFWMKYYVSGRPVRESCNTTSKTRANRLLQTRLQALATGEPFRLGLDKITVSELAGDFLQDYRINDRKSLEDAESRWRLHLKPWFGHLRASHVSSDVVRRYIEHRQQQEDAANATINRELAALKRMFSLAIKATPPKAHRVPAIPRLKENNVRKGFLSDDKFEQLASECSAEGVWLRAMLEVGYTFGWRVSEVKRLRVRQVDLAGSRIFLDPGSTKNGQGRVVKFKPGSVLADLLQQCCTDKNGEDFVFTRKDGTPVKDFRGAWARVCQKAGVGQKVCKVCETAVDEAQYCSVCKVRRKFKELKAVGLLFHDLRRSAARNARASGVAEGVIMKLGGWKTREVFDRYAIIAESDMEDAINLIEARRASSGT